MKRPAPFFLRILPLFLLLAAWGSARADEVPYVPTPEVVVDAMLSIGEVTAQDNLVDLGSGDGRIVIEAAKRRGAHGVGIEYNHELVTLSRENALREGVSDQVAFLQQDIFVSDFRKATVVTMYLLPEVNLQLRPRILSELRPGTRVVSHDWDMGDWEPDVRRVIETPEKTISPIKNSLVFLWIVPARVEGRWSGTLSGPDGELPVVLEFDQRYQAATVRMESGNGRMTGSGRIRGEIIALLLDPSPRKLGASPLRFDLRVKGTGMEGEARDGKKRYILRVKRPV